MSLVARNISDWVNNDSLRLNQDKTKAIILCTCKLVDRINKLNYTGIELGGGAFTPFVNKVKSFGTILESKLS